MKTYIAILRGINVGGKRILKMDALRQLFVDVGLHEARTYIQSGNVLFRVEETDKRLLERKIVAAIKAQFLLDVPVIVIGEEELVSIVAKNPFLTDASKNVDFLHLTFLSELPDTTGVEKLLSIQLLPDEFQLIDRAIYLYCPMSYSNSKLTNGFFEKKLNVAATTRNWKTVNELLSMANNMSSLSK